MIVEWPRLRKIARQDLGFAWSDASLRFFGVLHPLTMLAAAAVMLLLAGCGSGTTGNRATSTAVVIVSGLASTTPFTTTGAGCATGLAAGGTATALRAHLLGKGDAVYTAPAAAGRGQVHDQIGSGAFGICPTTPPETMTIDTTGSIDLAGEHLARFLDWLRTDKGVQEVDLVGHSMGGGATPYLAQQAAARGWGSEALWLFQLAPVFTTRVGSGPIKVPGHTRVVVETYDNDFIVDARSGIQQYRDYAIPSSQKKYVMVRTDDHGGPAATLLATHTSPNSLLAPEDAIRFYGIYRVGDALESCALWGKNCDADLTYMGKWSDGREVRRSISSANPVDAGPPAIIFSLFGIALECESSFNPRAHTCPPSRP